ncbi:hypothetical protein BCEP4_2620003 [Burkholderia cepacia]|nr:hypothetical protein BCEP4_2620003 [Burkholderia cepacia]
MPIVLNRLLPAKSGSTSVRRSGTSTSGSNEPSARGWRPRYEQSLLPPSSAVATIRNACSRMNAMASSVRGPRSFMVSVGALAVAWKRTMRTQATCHASRPPSACRRARALWKFRTPARLLRNRAVQNGYTRRAAWVNTARCARGPAVVAVLPFRLARMLRKPMQRDPTGAVRTQAR